jgi:DNA helicase-2/ATP-dependent DNA helicase PcrA
MGSNEDLEEERRLCYVGITRARRKLFITWTPFRKSYGADAGFPAKMSRFLGEMPKELLEGLDREEPDYVDQRLRYRDRFHEASASYGPVKKYREEAKSPREDLSIQPKTIAELKAYIQQKERAFGTEKESPANGPMLKPGMRVRHEQFGDGIVLSRERSGNEIKLTVTFSRVGRKSLIERYAKLQALK